MQSTFIYTVNLLKLYLFQGSNDTGCSVGLRQAMKSILEPEEGLRPALPFFWNSKKCPGFGRKGPDFVHHPKVKCIIQNIVLRVS